VRKRPRTRCSNFYGSSLIRTQANRGGTVAEPEI
jgi:hypothetical protein